ncbi:MAG: HAD family hydrolase [Methanosarcinales archaeon]|jgi:soluble P-type ATPase|nr:HAD family hydrolase [Methanosarcinales archaeon]MCD4798157.1 HAD family hydrolase [Methanosarcinales archaeon]
MHESIAVVFDSAGTLLQMYRVAKDTITGRYIDDIITTDLVSKKPNCGLVIMHTDPGKIMSCRSTKRIYEFLTDNNIRIDLSCSSSPITLEDVDQCIKNDTRTSMKDIHDVVNVTKLKCPDVFYLGIGFIVETESQSILYTVSTGGRPFTNTPAVLDTLQNMNIDTYIASGDSMRNLENLARLVEIPIERVYDVATPQKKEWVIKSLKKKYDKVVMVGDGINDILALRASDLGILSIQQTGTCMEKLSSEGDIIITDIKQIIKIINEMKQ